jgi:membrane protein DedA with SNARE-associated domain
VLSFLALGYWVGEEWRKIMPTIEAYLWLLAVAVVVLGLLIYLIHTFRRLDRGN